MNRCLARRRATQNETGGYAIITAILLTMMGGMAALGIDYSNVRMLRTKAQNSADAAVLAGAQDLPNESVVVQNVKAYALKNFEIPAAAWANCRDADALEEPIDGDTTNECISTDSAHQRLRVQLPTTWIDTWFGKSVGVNRAAIGAWAEAEVLLHRDNRIIPATVTSTTGTGIKCIEASGANTACAGGESGNFGSLKSPRQNIHLTTNTANALTINYSIGIDHNLTIWGVSDSRICDGDNVSPCTTSNVADHSLTPNYLNTDTGNRVTEVTDGLVLGRTVTTEDGGATSFCGRLTRPNLTDDNIAEATPSEGCIPAPPTATVLGQTINGHHISMWLTPAARSAFYPEIAGTNPGIGNIIFVPGDARLACYIKNFRATQPLPNCVAAGLPTSPAGPIFLNGILYDPRFGKIPIVCTEGRRRDSTCTGTMPSGGSTAARIVGFWGVFLYTLEVNGGDQKVHGVSSWVYDLSLIQQDANQNLEYGIQSTPVVHLAK